MWDLKYHALLARAEKDSDRAILVSHAGMHFDTSRFGTSAVTFANGCLTGVSHVGSKKL